MKAIFTVPTEPSMISWKKQISKQLYSLVNVREIISHKTLFTSRVVLDFFLGIYHNVATFWPSLLFFQNGFRLLFRTLRYMFMLWVWNHKKFIITKRIEGKGNMYLFMMLSTYMLNCQIVMCDMFNNIVSQGFSVGHATESPVLTELVNI